MSYRRILTVVASILVSVLSKASLCQNSYLTDTGLPVYGQQLSAILGEVSASNGNIHIDLPLTTTKQRGKLSGDIHLTYDSKIWQVVQTGGSSYSWQPLNVPTRNYNNSVLQGGWRFQMGDAGGAVQITVGAINCYLTRYSFTYTDRFGSTHSFPIETKKHFPTCGSSPETTGGQGFASDGSGYQMQVNNFSQATVWDPQGNQVYPTAIDTNQNTLVLDGSFGTLTDTQNTTWRFGQLNNNSQSIPCSSPAGPANCSVQYTLIPVSTSFGESGVSEFSGSIWVISSLTRYDGASYTFTYDSGTSPGHYGELIGVTLPTGGKVAYRYLNFLDSYQNQNRWLVSVAADGGTSFYYPSVVTQCTQNGSQTDSGCKEQVRVVAPSGDETIYTNTIAQGAWNSTTAKYTGSSTSGVLMTTTTHANTYTTQTPSQCVVDPFNNCTLTWLTKRVDTTTFTDTGLQTASEKDYTDTNSPQTPWYGLPGRIAVYDFNQGSQASSPLVQTLYTHTPIYGVGSPFGQMYLAGLTVEDGSGTPFSSTFYAYDTAPLQATNGLPQHQSLGPHLGNLMSVQNGPYPTTFAVDDAGSVVSAVDPIGNATSQTSGHTTSFTFDAYDSMVAQVTRPTTNGQAHISSTTYNNVYHTAQQTDDENSSSQGQTLSTKYNFYQNNDGVNASQLKSITYPDGGSVAYSYPDPNTTIANTLQNASTGTVLTTTTTLDGYGRPTLVVANGYSMQTTYDTNGRVRCVSHPFTQGVLSTTDGTECTTSWDGLDRPLVITHSDGTTRRYAYLGNKTTVTDEGNRQKMYTHNALAQLTQVLEPDANGSLTWETDYTYTPDGQPASVIQHGGYSQIANWRTRYWIYDSYGRLKSETMPESGTVCYGNINNGTCQSDYDANGNLNHRTDATGVTTFSYDALNRLTAKSSVATSNAGLQLTQTYVYDSVPAGLAIPSSNNVGRVAATMDTSGGTTVLGYDAMGRVTNEEICFVSSCTDRAIVGAVYDTVGNMTALTYPDGRTIQNAYDATNRLSKVQYTAWNGQQNPSPTTYWSAPQYLPPGQVLQSTLGQKITTTATFSSKGVPTSLQYAGTQGLIWKKQYVWDSNASNLTSMSDGLSGISRLYGYDTLNRLTSAVDQIGTSTSASAVIEIDGTEGYQCNEEPQPLRPGGQQPCSTPVWDTGYITLGIGSFSASVPYREGSSTGSLITEFVVNLNNTASSPVKATQQSSNKFSITATQAGAAGNFSLSTTSDGDFSLALPSGMSGGQNAATPSNGINVAYSPDPFGNMSPGNTQVAFNAQNQNPAITYAGAGLFQSDGGSHTYSYDPLGRLAMGSSLGGNAAFTYNADNLRVAKQNGAGKTRYVSFMGVPIATLSPQGGWNDFIYASGLIAEVPGTQSASEQYRLLDHLGSLAVSTDSAGGSQTAYDNYPFGQRLNTAGNDMMSFTSLERNDDTDTTVAMYRDLQESSNRWLTPDPYRGSYDFADPQSLNRYSYLSNRPLSSTDPTGLFSTGDGSSGGCSFACDVAIVADVLSAIFGLDNFFSSKPQFHGNTKRRPDAQPWDEKEFGSIHPTRAGIGMLFPGVQSVCEFGACGSSLSPQDPNNRQSDGISGVINLGTAWDAVWGGISGLAKYAGCGIVGAGKGAQSFFGLPVGMQNGPPGQSSVLRAGRGSFKIGAPRIIYRLSQLGPLGRVAGDLVPGLGELLLYGQGTLAVSDGARAAYDCGSKVK